MSHFTQNSYIHVPSKTVRKKATWQEWAAMWFVILTLLSVLALLGEYVQSVM